LASVGGGEAEGGVERRRRAQQIKEKK